jgi:hypothetical protein
MDPAGERALDQPTGLQPAGYEPPRVESVLSPAELEREILYAGGDFTGDAG